MEAMLAPPPLIPYEPKPIRELSAKLQVYIFNAGPFRQVIDMGSYGSKTLPALDKSDCLTTDMKVAGPIIIPGLPSECVDRNDNEWVRQYHKPEAQFEDNPGMDFALRVVEKSLRAVGVFVSQNSIPLNEEVRNAQESLRKTAALHCDERDNAFANGRFAIPFHEDAVFAHILGKTPKWLL